MGGFSVGSAAHSSPRTSRCYQQARSSSSSPRHRLAPCAAFCPSRCRHQRYRAGRILGSLRAPLLKPRSHQRISLTSIVNPSSDLKWAVEILQKYRDRAEDGDLKLWRTILETEQVLHGLTDAATIRLSREKAIKTIRAHTEPQGGGVNFRDLSFAADHVYQEALDYLAWLYAYGPETDAKLSVSCGGADNVVTTFQRILLLRSRLLTRTDLLWWRSPTKLNIYFLYLHLGGQKGKITAAIYDTFNKCPGLIDKIKELHSAIAFKQFQEPETWLHGTPLSSALNGAAERSGLFAETATGAVCVGAQASRFGRWVPSRARRCGSVVAGGLDASPQSGRIDLCLGNAPRLAAQRPSGECA
jgi:hypothetical protein